MPKRLRLLPVLMVAAALGLTVRVGDLWRGVSAMAQEASLDVARTPTATWDAAPAAGADAATGAASEAAPSEAAPAPGGTFQLPPDPLTMTDEEVDLLQALAARRQELELRARRVEDREVLLQAAERRIEEKATDLQALRKSIEDLLKQHETETESQYDSLVTIYENMKPKDAARIFDELDMAVLLPVVERMKERKTAPILAKMNAEKAKAITTELAQRRALPAEETAAK